MAYARLAYTCDGTTTQFPITFEYVLQSHVEVRLDDVVLSDGLDYFWPNNGVIEFYTAPTIGSSLLLTRKTAQGTRLVDYQTGGILSEEILNTDSIQTFFMAQEALDIAELTMGKEGTDNWDAQERRLKNLALPVDPDDAIPLRFMQSEYPNVTAVKANEAKIKIVADDIANVNATAESITNVNFVGGSIANVNEVADNLDYIHEQQSAINTVASNIADVASLASQLDSVLTVAATFVTSETAPATPGVGDRWYQPSVNGLYIWDGTNWQEAAKYATIREYRYNVTAARTVFNGASASGAVLNIPNKAFVDVLVNGVTLIEGDDFFVTGTTQVTLNQAVQSNDIVLIRCWTPYLTAEITAFEAIQTDVTNKQADVTTKTATTTTQANLAKDWATKLVSTVDGVDFSAKYEANRAETQANTAQAGAASATASATLAQQWAIKDTYPVNATEYSAKYHATLAGNHKSFAIAASDSAKGYRDQAQAYALSAARQDMDPGTSASAPGLAFVGNPGLGFYSPAYNSLNIVSESYTLARFTTSRTYFDQPVTFNSSVTFTHKGESPNTPGTGPLDILASNPYAPSGWYYIKWHNDWEPLLMYCDFAGSSAMSNTSAGGGWEFTGWARIDREFVIANYDVLTNSGKVTARNYMSLASNGQFSNTDATAQDSVIRTANIFLPQASMVGFRPYLFSAVNVSDPDADGVADGTTNPTNAQIVTASTGVVDLGTNIASLGIYAGNAAGSGVRPRNTLIVSTGTATWTNATMLQTNSGIANGDRIVMFYSDGATENFNFSDYTFWVRF